MGRVDGVNRVGGLAAEKVGVLLAVHQEEIDIGAFVARLNSGLPHKRTKGSMQLRAGGVRWDFERKFCRSGHGKRLAHDDSIRTYRRFRDVIEGVRLNHAALFGSLLLLLILHPLGERSYNCGRL